MYFIKKGNASEKMGLLLAVESLDQAIFCQCSALPLAQYLQFPSVKSGILTV